MRQSLRISFFAFLAAVLAPQLFADNLTGRILDPQGNVVPDAAINLFDRRSGEQRTTISSKDGRFTFAGIPPGNYVLEAEASRAALIASEDIVLRGDQTREISLKVAGVRTEVVVTASTTPLQVTEVSKAVDIVDSAQLDLRDTFEIAEAVRALPGIQVQTLEGPGSFTTINTRGMRAVDTAVLIDGMRFRDAGSPQNDATAFLGNMTAVDLDRIEFMRGAGSSLYGSNAMAGVMNIASRSGAGPMHGELRAEGGGLGMIRSIVGIGGGLGGDRFGYSGSVSHLNVTQGVRDRSPYRNSSAQGFAKYALGESMTITGRIWGNNSYVTSTENPAFTAAILANSPSTGFVKAIPLPDDQLELFEKKLPFNAGNATYIPNQIDPDGRLLSSFLNEAITFQHAASTNATYRFAYQGVDTHRGYLDGPAGPGSSEPSSARKSHFNGRTNTVQARLDQRLGQSNFVVAGYEFERERYFSFNDTPANAARTSTIELQQHNHAVYGQDQVRFFGGQLQVTLSGRAQFFKLVRPVFSGGANPYQSAMGSVDTPNAYTGDAAGAYFVRQSQTKFRAHVGNSFRAPSSYERFGGSSTGVSIYGDPRLKPERLVALDGGIDQWLFQSKIQLSATMFYTKLQETIRFANVLPPGDPFRRFFGYQNTGGGIARGVELSAHVSPKRSTNIQASYTYTNTDSNTPTVGTNYYKILDLSPHTYTVGVTQWIARRAHATFEVFGRSDYVTTLSGGGARLFVFNGETKANVVFGYEIPGGDRRSVELYGKVENAFNQRAYEDGFIGPRAWAIGGIRVKY